MSPRPDVSEARKNQILDAAASIFARLGFHEARMDDIVEAAGLSKGALYWYFKSKDAIISALLERVFARSLDDLRGLEAAEGLVSERLLLLTRSVGAELNQMAALLPVSFEFYAIAGRDAGVRQFLKTYYANYQAGLAALIRQGIARGEFRAIDADVAARSIAAICEGLTLLWILDSQAFDWLAQAEASIGLLLAGLRLPACDKGGI